MPFNKILGVKVESFDPHAPKLRFDMKPELIGNPTRGILHGGVISAVLDVMAGFSIHAAMLDQDKAGDDEGEEIATGSAAYRIG